LLADDFLADDETARERLGRIADLIEGFETPYGLELLSTVHWILAHDQWAVSNPERVVEAVKAWNPRKAAVMREAHIRTAIAHLQDHGWVDQLQPA